MYFAYNVKNLIVNELTTTKPENKTVKALMEGNANIAFDLYLPNVLNINIRTNELDLLSSEEVQTRKSNTRSSRTYWWM